MKREAGSLGTRPVLYDATPFTPEEWTTGALCASGLGFDVDNDLWFSEVPEDMAKAKEYCQECPVMAECLAGAREREEQHGVWGGEVFDSTRTCNRGHLMTFENSMVQIDKRRLARGKPAEYTACKACHAAASKRRAARKRESKA